MHPAEACLGPGLIRLDRWGIAGEACGLRVLRCQDLDKMVFTDPS